MIDLIRYSNFASLYSTNMSPAAAQVVIGAMRMMLGEDGTNTGVQKLKDLKENSNFFRQGMFDINIFALSIFNRLLSNFSRFN